MISKFNFSRERIRLWKSFRLPGVLMGIISALLFMPSIASAVSLVYLDQNAQQFVGDIKEKYGEMINVAALLHDYDATMIIAVMVVESEGNKSAVSHRGAQGLMQLMPGTAKAMGAKKPEEPFQNILAGTKYLKQLEEIYGFDSIQEALVAYNMGPTRAKRWLSQYDAEEYDYVQKVMHVYRLIIEREIEDRRLAERVEPRVTGAIALSSSFKQFMAKPRNISLSVFPVTLPGSRRSGSDID